MYMCVYYIYCVCVQELVNDWETLRRSIEQDGETADGEEESPTSGAAASAAVVADDNAAAQIWNEVEPEPAPVADHNAAAEIWNEVEPEPAPVADHNAAAEIPAEVESEPLPVADQNAAAEIPAEVESEPRPVADQNAAAEISVEAVEDSQMMWDGVSDPDPCAKPLGEEDEDEILCTGESRLMDLPIEELQSRFEATSSRLRAAKWLGNCCNLVVSTICYSNLPTICEFKHAPPYQATTGQEHPGVQCGESLHGQIGKPPEEQGHVGC